MVYQNNLIHLSQLNLVLEPSFVRRNINLGVNLTGGRTEPKNLNSSLYINTFSLTRYTIAGCSIGMRPGVVFESVEYSLFWRAFTT